MIKTFASELDYTIPPELRKYIVQSIYGDSEFNLKTSFPVYANGFPLMIYVYGDPPVISINGEKENQKERLYLAGQVYNLDASIDIDGRFGLVGFLLYPSAPYYLLHRSGEYFLNKWQSFRDASPVSSQQLLESLQPEKHWTELIALMLDFIRTLSLTRLPPIEWLDQSLSKIYHHNGIITIETLADNSGVSGRHYRRKFKEVIGVPPKYFCKVVQLNSVFEMIKSSEHENLHHLALDYGYFDQAHFITDFKKLIGESPNKFLMGKSAYLKTYMGKRGL